MLLCKRAQIGSRERSVFTTSDPFSLPSIPIPYLHAPAPQACCTQYSSRPQGQSSNNRSPSHPHTSTHSNVQTHIARRTHTHTHMYEYSSQAHKDRVVTTVIPTRTPPTRTNTYTRTTHTYVQTYTHKLIKTSTHSLVTQYPSHPQGHAPRRSALIKSCKHPTHTHTNMQPHLPGMGHTDLRDVLYVKIRNTCITRFRILCNLGVPIFDPKWTRFTSKSPKTFPVLFQYIICYYIITLEAH